MFLSISTFSICPIIENVKLGEFGVYQINVTDSNCKLEILKNPVFEYGGM